MINYHYIWINNKPDEDDKILNMIRKYSYPSCLAYDLTAVEKAEIRENEYFNIKNKIERSQPPERKVKIIQIPRILYDLYNIIYRREHFLTMDSFVCNLDMGANPADNTFDNFKTIINEKTNKVQQSIINMNDRFVNFLGTYNLIQELIKPEISTEVYLQIFDILYEKIVFNSSPGPIALARMASDTFHHLTRIESFDNIFNKRFKTILFQTLLIELGFIYDSTNDKYILNKESDIMILYRGYSGNILSTFNEPRAKAHSNSFNTSILNGIIHDQGANTYNYMKAGCDKAFYLIKKHFYSDKTDVNNIFFIPPIHPFLLLYGSGEYWHARSKIHIGAPRAIGLATTVSDFIQSSLPKDELEAKFQAIVKPLGKILLDKYYAKYLKYKQKYLSLKNIEK